MQTKVSSAKIVAPGSHSSKKPSEKSSFSGYYAVFGPLGGRKHQIRTVQLDLLACSQIKKNLQSRHFNTDLYKLLFFFNSVQSFTK